MRETTANNEEESRCRSSSHMDVDGMFRIFVTIIFAKCEMECGAHILLIKMRSLATHILHLNSPSQEAQRQSGSNKK